MAQLSQNIKKMEGTIFDIKSKISNQEYISLMNLLAQVYKGHTEVCKVAKRVGPLQATVQELVRRYKIERERLKTAERRAAELEKEAKRLRVNPHNKRLQNQNESLRKKLELMELELELHRLGLMEQGESLID